MFRIGIAGGGIAGTAAAAFLARAGHLVTVFERAPALGAVGAGLLLQVSGQEVLAELGLLERVVAQSEPLAELRAFQVDGRTLIRIPYAAAEPPCRGYGVARGTLYGELLAACRGAGAAVVPGVAIERAEDSRDGTYLLDPMGARYGPFDFVLGADGARSALRSNSRIRHRARPYGFGALWATGPSTRVRGYLHQVVRGTEVLIGVLPMGEGRASLFWGDFQNRIDALRARGFAAWRDELLALCPQAEEVFTELSDFDQTAFVTYQHVTCKRWRDRNLLLLGDAAHAMSPHLGQGANLALADASSFAAALAETGDFAAACARHEERRRPPTDYLSRLSYLLTPFFQSGSGLLGFGRDLALPILMHVPSIRRRMATTLAGTMTGWRFPRPPAGELAP